MPLASRPRSTLPSKWRSNGRVDKIAADLAALMQPCRRVPPEPRRRADLKDERFDAPLDRIKGVGSYLPARILTQ